MIHRSMCIFVFINYEIKYILHKYRNDKYVYSIEEIINLLMYGFKKINSFEKYWNVFWFLISLIN